jgi:hypothetical protein
MRKLITTIALAATCITGATVSPQSHHYSQPGSVSANRSWGSAVQHTTTQVVLANRTWSGVSPNNRTWGSVSPNNRSWT